jgi:hypothetical protein
MRYICDAIFALCAAQTIPDRCTGIHRILPERLEFFAFIDIGTCDAEYVATMGQKCRNQGDTGKCRQSAQFSSSSFATLGEDSALIFRMPLKSSARTSRMC